MAYNNNMFLGNNNTFTNFVNNTGGLLAKATSTNSILSDATKKAIAAQVEKEGLQGMDKELKIQEYTQRVLEKKKQQEYEKGRADVKTDLAWKSLNASNEQEAQAYKNQGKLADLADMVRGYIRNTEGREIAGNDDEIVAAFLKDNQEMIAPFASYMSGNQSAYEFAKMYDFDATPEKVAEDKRTKGWRSSLTSDQGEWNDDILGHFDYESYDEAGEGFLNKAWGFTKNAGKSLFNLGSDVVNLVANPIDTVNNLAKTAVGGIMNLTTLDDYLDPEGEGWINSANQLADGLGDVLKERYGSWEGIKNTAYTDPFGMVSDIASIIEGGAGLVKGVSKGAALGAAKVGAKGAGALEKVASTAGKVADIAHRADPFVGIMEGGTKGISYAGNKVLNSKIARGIKNNANNLTDSIVGLDNETKKAIQSNPYAGSTWREVENYIDENGLPTRSQEVSKSLIADLSTAVQEDLKNYINQFNETGPLYKSLKNGNYSVDLTKAEYKAKLDDFLKEKGVIIGEDGSLNFSDTAVTPTEASAIRRAYNWLSPNEAQPVSQYLRHRKGIDQLGLWEDAKGTPGKEILKGMREFANEEAHNQIKPLAELDKLYSEQVDLLNKATEGLVYRDKRRYGEYRDNFNQILKNMDTPNRKRLKDRLEKILPGLEQKVEAINLMPKLIDNYYRPGKADKRLSSAGGVVGTALGGGLPGLAVGAGVGYGLSKLYDKIKTNRWDKAISSLSDEGKAKMVEIEKAIAENKALSKEQAAALKAISSELKANKAIKEGQIAEIMGRLSEVENMDQLDGLIAELRKIGADDAVKELEGIKEQTVKNMAEQAEMDRYAEEFEAEKQNIINESSDQRLPEFKRRIYQLGQEERRIGSVAGKEIGKTFEGRDFKNRQNTEWLKKKEGIIKDIEEYYNVDQFEASEIFDRIERTASADDLGFSRKPTSSKAAKYGAEEENITPQIDDERLNKDPVDIDLDMMHERWKTETQQSINNLRETIDKWEKAKEKANGDMSQWNIFDDDNLEQAKKQLKDLQDTWDFYEKNQKYQRYGTANPNERGISATEGLNIRNFKNGKTVQELANQYGIDTKIVDSISTLEGQKAYGMYGDRLITLSKDLKESTVPHELLHGVFDIVDGKRRTSILEGIQKKLNIDNVQAEEWLADNFSEYYRTGKFDVKGIPTTFVGKVKQFFQQIKEYIDGTYANRKEIGKLFDDIIDGKIEGEYGVYSDPRFQSVWHGSPADFERFDSTHMGEGEGAQAHGWGHYVAVNKETGERYAGMGGEPKNETTYKGRTILEYSLEEAKAERGKMAIMGKMDEGKSFEDAKKLVLDEYKGYVKGWKELLKNRNWDKIWWDEEKLQKAIKEGEHIIETAEDARKSDFKVETRMQRNLYELEIPDPIEKDTPTGSNYFEEDGWVDKKAVDKIVKKVKESGLEVGAERGNPRGIDNRVNGYMTEKGIHGKNMYHILNVALGGEKEASKFLESLGYDGIHYFGGRDGEAYVIFNDDALEITKHHKY